MVGPSTTSTPWRRASAASNLPTLAISRRSQEDARQVADGRFTEPAASVSRWPRTPTGPSETVIFGSPRRGSAWVNHRPEPLRSLILAATGRVRIASSTSASKLVEVIL